MKVLMFGWEFPPHISGGLGTACHGLVHALYQQGVDVLFVIPRILGNEQSGGVTLINASAVRIPKDIATTKTRTTFEKKDSGPPLTGSKFTTLSVDSPLVPYQYPSEYPESSLLHWNYNFPKTSSVAVEKNEINRKEFTHTFSGSYGPDLLLEVDVYAKVAKQLALQNSFDVIHAHDWLTYPAGIAAKLASNKPLVVHVHATEYDRSGENVHPGIHEIEKRGLETADNIIAVSHWTKNVIVARYGIHPEKVQVVHNGVVADEKKSVAETKQVLGSHLITFMGRVTYQKGPAYFIEAAKEVIKEFPDAHFVMAGSGDLLPQIIERVAQLQISANFHFTGFLKKNDVDRIWNMTSVYVMPSVSEPFGITPLEAIQSGVPVILSKQSGVAEVMPHAITVDFWNTRALAGAICSMLRYDTLSKALKENGKKEINNLNWNVSAKKIKEMYDEITDKSRQKSRAVLSGTSTKKTKHSKLL